MRVVTVIVFSRFNVVIVVIVVIVVVVVVVIVEIVVVVVVIIIIVVVIIVVVVVVVVILVSVILCEVMIVPFGVFRVDNIALRSRSSSIPSSARSMTVASVSS